MKKKPLIITIIIGLAIIAVAVVLMFVKNDIINSQSTEAEEEPEPEPKPKRKYQFKTPIQDAEIVNENTKPNAEPNE
jgi:flagellar basal body-associated protein FliL